MKNIIQFLIASLLLGCSGKEINYVDLSDLKEEKADVVELNSDLELVYPMQIEELDGLLIVMDWGCADNHYFHIYNKNGELIRKVGAKGNAKGELISPTQFFVDYENKTFSVNQQNRLVNFDIAKIINNESDYASDMTLAKQDYFAVNSVSAPFGLFNLGFTDSMRFALDTGNTDYIYNTYPEKYEVEDSELKAAVMSYGHKIYFSPDKHHFVQGSYIGALLETFELSKKGIKSIGVEAFSKPIYERLENNAVSWGENSVIGFDNISTTNSNIFALCSQCKGSDLQKGQGDFFSRFIYVFNWKAKPLYKINVNEMMISISVSKTQNQAYAVSFKEGTYSLIRLEW